MTTDIEGLLNQWDIALEESGLEPSTRRRYLSAIRAFAEWFAKQNNEPFTPARITPIDLTGYRTMLQREAATSTVNVHLCALRAFCGWLVEQDHLTTNPAERLKAVGTQAPLAPKALTASQTNALLREAQQTRHPLRDYAIVQVLVQSGIRISECAALCLGDVQVSERQGQIAIRKGKGDKARVVPLNASARRALLAYLAQRWQIAAEWKPVLAIWRAQGASTPLWHSQKGNRLSVRAMSGMVEQVVAACGVRNLAPDDTSAHTFRHTFATMYLKDNPGDLVGLAALLGHSSLETTRIYVQPTADDLAQRVEQSRLNAYS